MIATDRTIKTSCVDFQLVTQGAGLDLASVIVHRGTARTGPWRVALILRPTVNRPWVLHPEITLSQVQANGRLNRSCHRIIRQALFEAGEAVGLEELLGVAGLVLLPIGAEIAVESMGALTLACHHQAYM